jgi:hypothetical protein
MTMTPKDDISIGDSDEAASPNDHQDTAAEALHDDKEEEEEESSPLRESMLDTFPLSGEELDIILKCYPNFQPEATFYTLVQGNCADDETMPSHLERIRYAEDTFLPEATQLLRQAYEDAFVVGSGHDDENKFKYLEAMSSLIGRRSPKNLIQIIYRVAGAAANDDEGVTTPLSPEKLAGLVYRLILAAHFLQSGRPQYMRPAPPAWIDSLSQKVSSSCNGVSEAEWMEWVNAVAPQVHQTLSTFVHCALFAPHHPFRLSNPPLRFPLTDTECALWSDSFQTAPSSIALLSPQLGGKWIREYSSDFDGFSFSTFQQALLGYLGPTVILIQTTAGDSFGFYSSEPWKESRQWFGHEADSFLFGLKPSLQFYGPTTGKGKHSMYLNNPVLHNPGHLYGLCVGGVADTSPRLHITPSFERCKAQSFDGVFDMGPLLSNHELYFDIDVIEIWAVNNVNEDDYVKAIAKGKAQQEFREGMRVKSAKVDKRLFLEDFQEGIFGTRLFEHRHQARGRHSFVADNEDGLGYFIEEKPHTPKVSRGKRPSNEV